MATYVDPRILRPTTDRLVGTAIKAVNDEASGGTGEVTSADITDATTVGVEVLTATDAAAARSAIGAGTSSLVVGTTAATAKAGNYQPTWEQVTNKPAVIGAGADAASARAAIGAGTSSVVVGTGAANAAAGNHNHAIAADVDSGLASAANLQAAFIALSARLKVLEDAAGA